MRYLPTGEQMRKADSYTIEQIGLPSMVLMERAALQVVEKLEREKLDLSKVLVVCGSGNNGGDGYAVARLLHLKGIHVEILFAGKDTSRSAENRKQKEIAEFYQIPVVEEIQEKEYSVIVDAIFGTGLKREIEGNYYDIISLLNQKTGIKVSIDIPSGIHDTSGAVMGIAFRADYTVAIAFAKRGSVLYPGAQYVGKIVIGDIGITKESLSQEERFTYGFEKEDLKFLFPKRQPDSHKGSYGKVLLVVGSKGMSGAAFLSAKASYAVGAGLVQIYTAEENRVILQQLLPEAIITTYTEYDEKQLAELLSWADVVGIGSGLGKSDTAVQIVRQTLRDTKAPCVVDADALNIIAEYRVWLEDICGQTEWKQNMGLQNSKRDIIFTPHMKEMARLLDSSVSELAEQRIPILTEFVSQYPVVCVLKDARTLVAKQDENLYVNLSGNAAMAKAGSGDVLTGIITGIVAQRVEACKAACLGVYLHGLAGDAAKEEKGSYSVLASDIIDSISDVLKEI
ncbi:MAG: NAD(P)H-hydrate dehydratase [Tyzzerella sp.]|nr:NAD(P)H-hydrate dehydratase [Tyzzerella sp.]